MQSEPIQIEQVAQALWRVPLITPTVPPATRTNAYVLEDESGVWIVDPGSPLQAELERLIEHVDSLLEERPLAGIIVTHHHPDHWGGLDTLLSWRPAPVIAREPQLFEGIGARFLTPGDPKSDAELDSVTFELYHTPGHARDHLVVLTAEGDLIAGDLVAGVGTVVIDPPDGDLAEYLDSLERMIALRPGRLFPSHGPTIDDGLGRLEEYVAHRLMREEQVIRGLTYLGPCRPSDLVPGIYPDVPRMLYPLAARSVLAHLLKLESDGRVEKTGRRWRIRGRS